MRGRSAASANNNHDAGYSKKKVKRIKNKASQKKTSNGRRRAETVTHTVVSRRQTVGKTQSSGYC